MDFVALENAGKKIFEQFPFVKRTCKRVYQLSMYAISREKFKVDGDIIRVSPNDEYEYFYGYYDKSPWDITDRYMLCIRVKQAYKSVAPKEAGEVVIIDTKQNNKVIVIGATNAWNVQQGCMAQWLGPDYSERIIYNDFRGGIYCSVIFNVKLNKEEKVINRPVYDVSKDGKFGLSLDFSRLHRLRKGYGYSNLSDSTEKELCPDKTCIWRVDLEHGKVDELFKYTDFEDFELNETMVGAEHKVNHIMISPNGKRFMVLHRWLQNGRKNTRLITVNCDGTDMYNLSDDVFVSHCYWKNDNEILSFLRKKETGDHYYLMKDKTQQYEMFWNELNTDGHCSYSQDGKLIITDTYPNRKRLAHVFVCKENGEVNRIASVFAPFRYDNDVRCDLHPRWNHKGNKVCVDSVHDGKRGLYVIPIETQKKVNLNETTPMASVIVPCYNAAETLPLTLKSLEKQTFKNFEVIIIDDGSNDNVEDIVKCAKKSMYLNIIFQKQKNSGVSAARNHGLKLAKGKYVCFLDGDDVYHPRFLEKTIELNETNETDVVLTYQSRDINTIASNKEGESFIYRKVPMTNLMSIFMYEKENIHFGGLLYNREIINSKQISFSVGTKYGEDLEFAWKYMTNCKNGIILKNKMYGYYNNPKSAVNTVRWEKTDLVEAMFRVEKYMKNNGNVFERQFSNYMLPRTVWTTAKTFAVGNREDYYKKFIKDYPVNVAMKKLTKYSRNKLLKISAIIFCVNSIVFYNAIKIIYKNR